MPFIISVHGASGSAEENSSKDPKKSLEEAIDIPQAEMSHPQPSKIEEKPREFDLPFGWKKIAYKRKVTIKSPNGKYFNSFKEIEKFVLKHPEMKCDAKLTNFSIPLELRKELRNCNICNGKYDWRGFWQHKRACQKKNAGKTETNEDDENNIPSILTGSNPGQDPQPEMSNPQPSKVEEIEAKKKYDLSKQRQEPPKKPMDENVIPQVERTHPGPSKIEENRLEFNLPFGWKKIGKGNICLKK